jgi:hypothetical protein
LNRLVTDPELSLTVVEHAVPLVDWDSIHIQEEIEEEGRIELFSEK